MKRWGEVEERGGERERAQENTEKERTDREGEKKRKRRTQKKTQKEKKRKKERREKKEPTDSDMSSTVVSIRSTTEASAGRLRKPFPS